MGSEDAVPEAPKQHKKKLLIWWAVFILIVSLVISLSVVLVHRHNTNSTANTAACSNPMIKGNISQTTGEKIYHKPGDRYYKATVIDASKGERWFCTDKEAQDAGWRHSKV